MMKPDSKRAESAAPPLAIIATHREHKKQTLIMKLLLSLLVFLFSGAAAMAADKPVGEVSFVIGSARIAAGPDSPRDLVRGTKISAGQVIETGDNGHVHLRFVDDATVAIRPQSRLRIEDFHYDAANPRENRIKFSLEQGTLRSVTGRAGEAAKDRYRLNTPIAAIGIKGTDFIVQVADDTTRVAVNSGAIVLAPLGEGCAAHDLGACSTSGARELTAAMAGRYLELKARYSAPELIQIDPNSTFPDRASLSDDAKGNRTRRSGSTANSSAGEMAALAAPTASGASAGAGSNAASIANTITDATVAATLPPAVPVKAVPPPIATPVPEPTPVPVPPPVVTPPPVVKPAPTPVPVPPVALPEIPVVPQIVWGRWSQYVDPAVPGPSFSEQLAVPGREVGVGNSVFGMLRQMALVTRMPEAGRASFDLAKSEVYLVQGLQLTPAMVTSAKLGMDFDARSFTTSLGAVPRGMDIVNMSSQGSILTDGRFYSDADQTMGVQGIIAFGGGLQAGYVFQKSLDPGKLLSGATLWIR